MIRSHLKEAVSVQDIWEHMPVLIIERLALTDRLGISVSTDSHIPEVSSLLLCRIGPQNASSTTFRLNVNIAAIDLKSLVTLWCCNNSSKQAELMRKLDQESRWKRWLHLVNKRQMRNGSYWRTYIALTEYELGGWFCRYSVNILWLSIAVVLGADAWDSSSEEMIGWLLTWSQTRTYLYLGMLMSRVYQTIQSNYQEGPRFHGLWESSPTSPLFQDHVIPYRFSEGFQYIDREKYDFDKERG